MASSPDPSTAPQPTPPIWIAGIAVLAVAAFLACSIPFASVQSIWLDEATQLAGLTLSPFEVARWLMGVDPHRFGLSPDRMPPLSYWVGWAWGRAFGHDEATFRALGMVSVALATVVVVATTARVAGAAGALVAGLLFALAPNVVTVAPEIRTYPLLLLAASAAFACLVGYARTPDRRGIRWLLGLWLASVAATYLHFFGLVLGGAVMGSAAVLAWLDRRPLAWPILAGVGLLIVAAGLKPFVAFSTALSLAEGETPVAPVQVGSFLRTLYRLVGHPVASVDLPALAGLILGFAGLIGLALLPRPRDGGNSSGDRHDRLAIPIALALGLGVTFLAGLKIRTFEVYKPSYSFWALPGVYILAGSAFAPGIGRVRKGLAVACALLALGASGWDESILLRHPVVFSHGPQRGLVALIDSTRAGGKDPVIVYDGDGIWGLIYFPLRRTYGVSLEQYVLPKEGDGPLEDRPMTPLAGTTRRVSLSDLPGETPVIVIRGAMMGQDEVRREIRGGGQEVASGPIIAALGADPDWVVGEKLRFFAMIAARAEVFRHRGGRMVAGRDPE